ncbi:phosphate starvation-inducible protein PhoH [Spartobacteria bacterium LR76]|nr:phosphate starvation-inducible protein PhoH [Spartobacteria bacterium LR76]
MATDNQETLTLEFDNARALQSLYGGDDKLLRDLEAALGVKVTTRDGWLRVEGPAEGVSRARKVFDQLDDARRRGVTIKRHEFQYALRSSAQEGKDGLGHLIDLKIQVSPKKAPVVPKTAGQQAYLRSILSHDITFGVGPAGTGKTYLAVAMAVAALKQEKVSRIILTRPAVEAGEALGFLPGDLQEKILPYLRPLYDALHDMLDVEEIQKYMDRGVIEIAPLAYMRGRTLSNAYVILDEAQNTTTEQMFMFLTRLGQDSKCVVTGDGTQIDLPRNKRSGLIEAVEALRKVPGIGFHFFDETDVVRHPLVQAIIHAYRDHRGLQESRFQA